MTEGLAEENVLDDGEGEAGAGAASEDEGLVELCEGAGANPAVGAVQQYGNRGLRFALCEASEA